MRASRLRVCGVVDVRQALLDGERALQVGEARVQAPLLPAEAREVVEGHRAPSRVALGEDLGLFQKLADHAVVLLLEVGHGE